MNKIQKNRLIAIAVLLAICLPLLANFVVSGFDFTRILPAAFRAKEEEWDPIAAGDRIEAAVPGIDVMHVGPLGGRPSRDGIAAIVLAGAEAYFGTDSPTEDMSIREDLGADDEMLVEFALLIGDAINENTKYSCYVSQNAVVEEVDTLADLIDYITERTAFTIGWLGSTPRFHVAIHFLGVDTSDSDMAIAIVGYEDGEPVYQILENGEYTWDEDIGTDEDVRLQWNFWTMEKWRWYVDNGGMFPPGKFQGVVKAIDELRVNIAIRRVYQPLFNAILKEAFRCEQITGEKWRLIELDYLQLGPVTQAAGIDSTGQPGYVGYRPHYLMGTRYIWRARAGWDYISERHAYKVVDYYLDRIFKYEKRELTREEVYDMFLDPTKTQYQPGMTVFGMIPYVYGFNHPWQARDMTQ